MPDVEQALLNKIKSVKINIELPKEYFKACVEKKVPLHKPIENFLKDISKRRDLSSFIEDFKGDKN